jgi:hypothetical protein
MPIGPRSYSDDDIAFFRFIQSVSKLTLPTPGLSTGFIEFHLHPEQRKDYESAEHFTDVQWLQYV